MLGVVRVISKGRSYDRPGWVDARRCAVDRVDTILYLPCWRIEASDSPFWSSHESVDYARCIIPGPRDRSLGIDGGRGRQYGAGRVERSEATEKIAQEAVLNPA